MVLLKNFRKTIHGEKILEKSFSNVSSLISMSWILILVRINNISILELKEYLQKVIKKFSKHIGPSSFKTK